MTERTCGDNVGPAVAWQRSRGNGQRSTLKQMFQWESSAAAAGGESATTAQPGGTYRQKVTTTSTFAVDRKRQRRTRTGEKETVWRNAWVSLHPSAVLGWTDGILPAICAAVKWDEPTCACLSTFLLKRSCQTAGAFSFMSRLSQALFHPSNFYFPPLSMVTIPRLAVIVLPWSATVRGIPPPAAEWFSAVDMWTQHEHQPGLKSPRLLSDWLVV